MRLGLSSAAAPGATFDELLDLCAHRGLAALELREGDAHGITRDDDPEPLAARVQRAAEAGIEIVGWVAAQEGSQLSLARLGVSLDTCVVVDAHAGMRAALERAATLRSVGASVAFALDGGESDEDLALFALSSFDLVWQADPSQWALASRLARLLDEAGTRLRHVQMFGGGPEAAMHEGRGVGAAMGRLALAGFTGAVVLAPGSTRYRVAWDRWLGRRGGWGCGSKASDPSLVSLESTTHTNAR